MGPCLRQPATVPATWRSRARTRTSNNRARTCRVANYTTRDRASIDATRGRPRPVDRARGYAPIERRDTMKAAVLNQQPGALDIEDLRIDGPGPGEVLLRTVGAGLCHSDLHFMEGLFPLRLPAVMGHESAGVVEAVGEG